MPSVKRQKPCHVCGVQKGEPNCKTVEGKRAFLCPSCASPRYVPTEKQRQTQSFLDDLYQALKELRGDEDEPCYKCGHAFADHQLAGCGGRNVCEVCGSRHAFQSFPEGWGFEPVRIP